MRRSLVEGVVQTIAYECLLLSITGLQRCRGGRRDVDPESGRPDNQGRQCRVCGGGGRVDWLACGRVSECEPPVSMSGDFLEPVTRWGCNGTKGEWGGQTRYSYIGMLSRNGGVRKAGVPPSSGQGRCRAVLRGERGPDRARGIADGASSVMIDDEDLV